MIKQLLFTTMTLGVVAGALAFGAYAFYFDGDTSQITANAATALDLTFDIDQNCDGTPEATGVQDIPDASTTDLYPGDTNVACVVINNPSTTDVDAYIYNDAFAGTALLAALDAKVDNLSDGTTPCPYNDPSSPQYTTANNGRGCFVGNVPPASSKTIRGTVRFTDDGHDQSTLAGLSETWNTNVGGYTTP